jgi:hypothetical protein
MPFLLWPQKKPGLRQHLEKLQKQQLNIFRK